MDNFVNKVLRRMLKEDYGLDTKGMSDEEVNELAELVLQAERDGMEVEIEWVDDEEYDVFDNPVEQIEDQLKRLADDYREEKTKDKMKKIDQKLNQLSKAQEQALFTFGDVIDELQMKTKWTRIEWDSDEYIILKNATIDGYNPGEILLKSSRYGLEKYIPSDVDIFAEDWVLWAE